MHCCACVHSTGTQADCKPLRAPTTHLQAAQRALAHRRDAAYAAVARGTALPLHHADGTVGGWAACAARAAQRAGPGQCKGLAIRCCARLEPQSSATRHPSTVFRPAPCTPCPQFNEYWVGTLQLRFSHSTAGAQGAQGGRPLPAPTRLLPLPFSSTAINSSYNAGQPNPFVFTTPSRLLRAVLASVITGACRR